MYSTYEAGFMLCHWPVEAQRVMLWRMASGSDVYDGNRGEGLKGALRLSYVPAFGGQIVSLISTSTSSTSTMTFPRKHLLALLRMEELGLMVCTMNRVVKLAWLTKRYCIWIGPDIYKGR